MLKTGLTSITFRQMPSEEIIALTQECGLDGIEWGGDVHAKPGDLATAGLLRAKTRDAGLTIPSYGSYYKCEEEDGAFDDTLATAKELGAGVIRVWAGRKGSDKADAGHRAEVAGRLRRAVDLAAKEGITVALEYHGGTLTDTRASAHQLLAEVGREELKLYWQPRSGGTVEGDLVELEAALPHLANIHLFHWGPGGFKDKRPLREGVAAWSEYLALVRQAEGDRHILFEFVKDGDPDQLREDAKVLHELIARTGNA